MKIAGNAFGQNVIVISIFQAQLVEAVPLLIDDILIDIDLEADFWAADALAGGIGSPDFRRTPTDSLFASSPRPKITPVVLFES